MGAVAVDCSLGPKTIMTDTEEMILCEYIVNMADIGFFQSGQHESGIEDRPIQKWCWWKLMAARFFNST